VLGPDVSDAKKREIQEKKKGIFLLTNPKNFYKFYLLNINIIKVEGLPSYDGKTGPTTYVSARVLGNTITTNTVRDSINPTFNTKLGLPVLIPTLNDKIIIKIWMQHSRTSVELLANIPEIPRHDDSFNISKLQGNEGRMQSRWFNLYGTLPEDRSMFFTPATSYYLEGNAFIGRVLISMNINPCEKPVLTKASANLLREPQITDYVLTCEPYEISNVTETQGREVRLEVTFGTEKEFTKSLEYKDKSKNYKFKSKHKINPMKAAYPIDPIQVPDVIVTLQAQKIIGGVWKVGYFRIKAADLLKDEGPRWYKFKSLEKPHSSPGKFLCNFILSTSDKIKPRKAGAKPTTKSQFKLTYSLFYCLDICPDISDEEKVSSKITVDLGTKNIASSEYKTKHIPVWNINGTFDKALSKDLSFAPDLTVSLHQKGYYYGENVVGEINIPLNTINKNDSQPTFYQFYSYGEPKGKLLAIFNIIESDLKPNNSDIKSGDVAAQENSDKLTYADVTIALVGIRNMTGITRDMKIEIELIYLKPNEDSTYEVEIQRTIEDENGEEEKEDPKHRKDASHDEEDSMGSMDEDDEERGPNNKIEMLERKSHVPELMQDLKKQGDEDIKKTESDDIEKNEATRGGDEINKNPSKVEILSPISEPNTNCPNFCQVHTFPNIPF
jgi:hypothetical protein